MKSKKRKRRNKAACWILVISGLLMIVGGVVNGQGIIGVIGQLLIKFQIITSPLLVFFYCSICFNLCDLWVIGWIFSNLWSVSYF